MAPIGVLCKQTISLLHPGKPVEDEWLHISAALRTGLLQRIAQWWRRVTARLRRRRLS